MPCTDQNCDKDREAKMVVIPSDLSPTARPVFCDPCIADVVRALNTGGLPTRASCCGHHRRPSSIILSDLRRVYVVEADSPMHALIEFSFPLDVNGQERRGLDFHGCHDCGFAVMDRCTAYRFDADWMALTSIKEGTCPRWLPKPKPISDVLFWLRRVLLNVRLRLWPLNPSSPI